MKSLQKSTLELHTIILVRELFDGSEACFPVADPSLISFSKTMDSIAEMHMFLELYLADQSAEVLARFSFPEGSLLEEIDVPVECDALGEKFQIPQPMTFGSIVIPHGRDQWVIIPAIDHIYYLTPKDNLKEMVASEIRRMIYAYDPSPVELLDIFPPKSHRLEKLTLQIDRTKQTVTGRAKKLRREALQFKRKQKAREILDSVGTPLHLTSEIMTGPPLIGRERELSQLDNLLGSKQRFSVMVIGSDLVGKTALINGWIQANRKLKKKCDVYALSGTELLAGMSGLGQWQERIHRVMKAAELLDAILYFDNLNELFSDLPESGVDIAGAMRPYIEQARVRLVGEVRSRFLDALESKHIGFVSALTRLTIDPVTKNQAQEVLNGVTRHFIDQEPERPNLDLAAVIPLIDLVDRYQPYQVHPGKAVAFYQSLRVIYEKTGDALNVPNNAAYGPRIGENEIYETFSVQSGIPVFLLNPGRQLHLEQVINHFKKQVIGQEAAIKRVAETICMIKAGLQPPEKPLAGFLFIGPTGVGKTEMTRSLARFLFRSEKRMLRFDMSEYMDPMAAQRLIQGSDRADGLLTRQVRQQPFGVLLLDEIEKAHPTVFDLLLQVLGEGRLTDGKGNTAYFNNTIIIMTSNLGAAHVRQDIGFSSTKDLDDGFYAKKVNAHFRPEFVNRLDRIIVFHPLGQAEIERITTFFLNQVRERRGFSEQGIDLDVSQEALHHIAQNGYSLAYGARQLKRYAEDHLLTPVARLISKIGVQAKGARIEVRTEKEIEKQKGSKNLGQLKGPLTITFCRQEMPGRRRLNRGVFEVADLRRQAQRYMHMDVVTEVKDRIDFIVTQLAELNRIKKKKKTARNSQPISQLQKEFNHLAPIWKAAVACVDDLESIEDLVIAALFEEEDPTPYWKDCQKIYQQFLNALFYLMTARLKHRNSVVLLVQELDNQGALNYWLKPLLYNSGKRKWQISFHSRSRKEDAHSDWPLTRHWGPPHNEKWTQGQLDKTPRAPHTLLLRANGQFAGAAMALEKGIHSFKSPDGKKAQMIVEILSFKTEFTDKEWKNPQILPYTPIDGSQLRKLPAIREYKHENGPCRILEGKATCDIPLSQYWARFEEIAVTHLLTWIDSLENDLNDLYLPRMKHGKKDKV